MNEPRNGADQEAQVQQKHRPSADRANSFLHVGLFRSHTFHGASPFDGYRFNIELIS
jgi:hypothetical protein